jgi:hypothetical protein
MKATTLALTLLVALAFASSGCCFGNHAAPASSAVDPGTATTGTVAPPPATGPLGLPNPPPLFAGVEPPYPDPLAARGTHGAIVRAGAATVSAVTGTLAGVATGTVCSYTEWRVVGDSTWDCRWNVTCGSNVLYGLGTGGYQHCEDSTWPAGTVMFDPNTSAQDNDPSFTFVGNQLIVSDDMTGRLGTFSVTLTSQ